MRSGDVGIETPVLEENQTRVSSNRPIEAVQNISGLLIDAHDSEV